MPGSTAGSRRETLGGRVVVIVHSLAWLTAADRNGADVIVCGHTHRPEISGDRPLLINPGDTLDVECTWNNDEGRVLPFGFEMCVVFAQFVDDTGVGSWACDDGHWTEF